MKEIVEKLVCAAMAELPDVGDLVSIAPDVERTRDPRHGDFSTNIAMRLAKTMKRKPRDLAAEIISYIPESEQVEAIEIAGPGFINFRLSTGACHSELQRVLDQGDAYGRSDGGAGLRVLVESVSSNPTGPLHVGHGRLAAYGATVANLLEATGHDVEREYYVNDAGRQMDILAASVWIRLLNLAGEAIEFPASGYRGQYIADIAQLAFDQLDETVRTVPENFFDTLPEDGAGGDADAYIDALIAKARDFLGEDQFLAVLNIALDSILGDIKDDLTEFGTQPDNWFSERSLMDSGALQHGLDILEERNQTYIKDGAVWFRATDMGDEKDRVVVRENGRTTYFASDIAYHLHKRERGFDLLLDVLGSDHHGYVARVRAGLEAMGQPPESLEVELVQFVVLYRGSEKVQMSTRSGQFVPLRELRREVGNDAARLFYVMRSNDQHLDFDLELAKSQSNDNPVYYIQYAHARVCSVMREMESRDLSFDLSQAEFARLTEDHERSLVQKLSRYPEVIELASRQRAPQHLVHYLRELAQEFHTYYSAHRFIVDDAALRNARLALILATRQVLLNGLSLLGVSAPDTM